jgi:hypothetical protein
MKAICFVKCICKEQNSTQPPVVVKSVHTRHSSVADFSFRLGCW